jgi:GNAT superfamily N-acetyltransferase
VAVADLDPRDCGGQRFGVVGAVAVSPDMRRDPTPGPRVAVHVIAPWRRRGVGAALVQRAGAEAATRGAAALYAWRPVSPGGDAARGWRTLGFRQAVGIPITYFEVARGLALMQSMYDRLVTRGAIPPDVRIVPLRDADARAVAHLHLTCLGGTPATVYPRLQPGGRDAFHPELSQVLLRGSDTLGIALVNLRADGVCAWDSNVLHPSLRGRWANVVLKRALCRACLSAGVKTFAVETYSAHADSLTSTQKVGGVTVWRVEPYRLLTPAAAAAAPAS